VRPSSVAIDLEDMAALLRRQASGIRKSGQPIELFMAGRLQPLDRMTPEVLEADAEALEADAMKLRTIYS
jgi:hypothetical protein